MRETIEQRLGLQQPAAALGIECDGVGASSDGGLVAPDEEFGADFSGHAVAKGDHLVELKTGVDMEKREGNWRGIEGLLRQAKHDGGVLADRVEHYRALELGGYLTQNLDTLGLEKLEMREWGCSCCHEGLPGR